MLSLDPGKKSQKNEIFEDFRRIPENLIFYSFLTGITSEATSRQGSFTRLKNQKSAKMQIFINFQKDFVTV